MVCNKSPAELTTDISINDLHLNVLIQLLLDLTQCLLKHNIKRATTPILHSSISLLVMRGTAQPVCNVFCLKK